MAAAPIVWVIDSEHWSRACLCAELIERGYDAKGYEQLEPALATLRRLPWRRPRAVVLEARGQLLLDAALDALTGLSVPVLLLGSVTALSEPLLQGRACAAVLRRPLRVDDIADAVGRALGRRARAAQCH